MTKRLRQFLFLMMASIALLPSMPGHSYAATKSKPNIVLFLVDDMTSKDMEYLPGLQNIAAQGVRFSNFATPTPGCIQSRASILRGQYQHNIYMFSSPATPWQYFGEMQFAKSTVATWLQQAGYSTALFGKYLNGYPIRFDKPPGWTEWYYADNGAGYNYSFNINGRVKHYSRPNSKYFNDFLGDLADDFIRRNHAHPMFLYIASTSPHTPEIPADRHKSLFRNTPLPTGPNYWEADVSDKPLYVRENPQVSPPEKLKAETERFHNRLRMLVSIQQLIERVTNELDSVGELQNTYFIFMSDNGWAYGEHRIPNQKLTPYAYANIVPAWVWGPGIPRGSVRNHLVANSDIAQTIAEWAGVSAPHFVDGRSLVPVISPAPVPQSEWRQALPLSFGQWITGPFPNLKHQWPPSYFGVLKASKEKYVHYVTGEEELYLGNDPYELNSRHADPEFSARKDELLSWAQSLNECVGRGCREADINPPASRQRPPVTPELFDNAE